MLRHITEHRLDSEYHNGITLWADDSAKSMNGKGAPTRYLIDLNTGVDADPIHSAWIHFCTRPWTSDTGIDGITNETLLAVVLDRLREFQKNPDVACRENALAITDIEAAMLRLQARQRRMDVARRAQHIPI